MPHLKFLALFVGLLALAALASAKDNDLIKAAGSGDVQRVKELIDAKADVETKDKFGRTPLMVAATNGHVDIVSLLLDKGANIEANDKFGHTALILAAASGKADVIKLLLDRGANIEARDKDRHTALMEAAMDGHVDAVSLLLDKGANIEAKGALRAYNPPILADDPTANVTALILAAANGKADVVKLLLDRGANPEAEKGRTTMTSTALLRATEAVILLREAAARHSAQATSGAPAPSQPALTSTSHIAGLYQSERLEVLDKKSKSIYEYLRFYCNGRVLEMGLGGDGKQHEIDMVAKALDQGWGSSGTYQIQGTAIQFSLSLGQATADYQGQIEGNGLSVDSFSHINSQHGHITYHLVQPGDCK
jgi:ankyrin repeat protein